METPTPISAANYTNTKAGYRKYIMDLGYTKEIATQVVMGYISSGVYMIITYKAFQNEHITKEGKLDTMYNDLEKMNDTWNELTTVKGQDDTDMFTDAFHMRKNIQNLIEKIEHFETHSNESHRTISNTKETTSISQQGEKDNQGL